MIGAQSYFTGRQLSDEERAQWEHEAEARRAKIREDALRMIGRDADGRPFTPADAGEEKRLASADLRAPLREAIAEREQITARLADQKSAVDRAKLHLDTARTALAQIEDAEAKGSRLAADQLIAQFRSGALEAAVIETRDPATTSTLDQARRAVEVAQRALDKLSAEASSTQRELAIAQHQVGRCALDVVKAELLRIGAEVATHDHAAAQGRANLEQAGYVTANLARRHNWPTARIFTSSTLAAMHPAPMDRPPPACVNWNGFINRLMDDAEAELE
jgi:hypothetical protein